MAQTEAAAPASLPFGDDAVGLELEKALPLAEFLRRPRPRLDPDQRLEIVRLGIALLEDTYVHLPSKRALYAVDPVRRLRLMQLRLERQKETGQAPPELSDDDLWFHREISETLTSVRDFHTIYLLPEPFARSVAFLPFQVEQYWKPGHATGEAERRFMVTNIVDGLSWWRDRPATFVRGVEVTHWNGIPIGRALQLAGERNSGGNPDARLERGLARMTIRPLAKTLPPDEEWVTITYRAKEEGPDHQCKVEWRVTELEPAQDVSTDGRLLHQVMGEGLDHETDMIRRMKRRMFAPKSHAAARARARAPAGSPLSDILLLEGVPEPFEARSFGFEAEGKAFAFGYVRIRTFKAPDHTKFLKDFVGLLSRLPPRGLVIDVRDNPGGHILSGERILQTLTPNQIQPQPMQFINNQHVLKLCETFPEYLGWLESVGRALETRSPYSASIPLSPVALCNDTGQRYHGPVVLIANAISYSTTDIFAAGFQDHGIGPVLGTNRRTGAGGANVATYATLRRRFAQVQDAARRFGNEPPPWPLGRMAELPPGMDFHVAVRRSLRVGAHAGMELEDAGVTPDRVHAMTRADLLDGNNNLIAEAARMLSERPAYRLDPRIEDCAMNGASAVLPIETAGIAFLNAAVDGWASASQKVGDGLNKIEIRLPPYPGKSILELRGYGREGDASTLLAARRLDLRRVPGFVPGPPPDPRPQGEGERGGVRDLEGCGT